MSPTGDLLVTLIFVWGWCHLELAQVPTRVALALHTAGRSSPFGVTYLCQVLCLPVLGLRCCQSPRWPGTGNTRFVYSENDVRPCPEAWFKLTWLVLGGDPAARSHRVEQLTAL